MNCLTAYLILRSRNYKMVADNILSFGTSISPDIVRFCVGKLKAHKDDGKHGFNSDHLINGTNKLCTVLFIMFNAMLTHGLNPEDLLRSTIISIRKDSVSQFK